MRHINSENTIDAVYTSTKDALLPTIICLYGAPTLGKSTLAGRLS